MKNIFKVKGETKNKLYELKNIFFGLIATQ